jgi:GWxTD domain-containing protein
LISSAIRDAARALVLLAACAVLTACGSSGAGRTAIDLTNPFLGPDYTGWLVGPIARLATPEEISAYQALTSDDQARAFVESFWAKRDATPDKPGNPLRDAFEERADAADKAYSESGRIGRRTDRGTIYILYGPPSKVDFDVPPLPQEPPIEVWHYDAATPAGLDGRKPTLFRFIKRGDLTVFYAAVSNPRLRARPNEPDDTSEIP